VPVRKLEAAQKDQSGDFVEARLARALIQLGELAGEDDGAGRVHAIGQCDLAAMAIGVGQRVRGR